MGAWNASINGNDTAQDLKSEYQAAFFYNDVETAKGDPELYKSCAVITDGRYSGGTSGLSVGYVSPEAALGGPLGLIKEGDIIEIDVAKRSMNVELSDEELAERKANFHWEFPADKYPRFLRLFVKNVGSMAKGGIWE